MPLVAESDSGHSPPPSGGLIGPTPDFRYHPYRTSTYSNVATSLSREFRLPAEVLPH